MRNCSSGKDVACGNPDCIRCLRRTLNADGIVVFSRVGDEWRISGFEGERPLADAEVDFYCLLEKGIPDVLVKFTDGIILNEENAVCGTLGSTPLVLLGSAVIASPFSTGSVSGVRVAWRSRSEPFEEADRELIRCCGNCPQPVR